MRTLIVTLTLLVTSSAAWAQLTNTELACRYKGEHAAAVLGERARGRTLTDTLLEGERQFEARQLSPAWRAMYHELTRTAWGFSDLTPEQGRYLVEGVCLEVQAEQTRTQSAMNRKPAPKRKTQDHFIRDPRPY